MLEENVQLHQKVIHLSFHCWKRTSRYINMILLWLMKWIFMLWTERHRSMERIEWSTREIQSYRSEFGSRNWFIHRFARETPLVAYVYCCQQQKSNMFIYLSSNVENPTINCELMIWYCLLMRFYNYSPYTI